MKISAIIPSYNSTSTLSQAIESVMEQTHPVQEIIVFDDGSSDNTAGIVAGYGQRVRYLCHENSGQPKTRNAAVQAANFPWLAWLDADDYWLPQKIELQVKALEKRPQAVLVYGSAWYAEPDGTRYLYSAVCPDKIWPALRYKNLVCGSHSAALVNKEAVLAAGGYDESLGACVDWDLWVRLRLRNEFAAVEEPVSVIRVSSGSISADPDRMIKNMERILEPTLLYGLQGWQRSLWRHKIRSAQFYSAAIGARDAHSGLERSYLWKSAVQWPAPAFLPSRWLDWAQNLLGARAYGVISRAGKRLMHLLTSNSGTKAGPAGVSPTREP